MRARPSAKQPLPASPWCKALLLAAALLLAQALGLSHRVAHAGLWHGAVAHAAENDASPGHSEGSAECRLVDQLGLGDAAPLAVCATALPSPATAPLASRAQRKPRPAHTLAYSARAPPATLATA
jgi:hypothetical protein